MLDFLRSLLGDERQAAARDRESLQVAAAALLVEAAMMDGCFGAEERAAVERALARHFGLGAGAAAELVALAEVEHESSVQLHRFAQAINDRLEPEERIAIIEMLWEVVYADGSANAYEANLLRRIGGLLYVPDRDRGAARKRVLARLGIADDQSN